MPLPPLTTPLRRRGLAVFVGLAMAGNVQAADLWTITQDALANDASLAAARANFQSVEASRDVVRGGLLPQVSLTGEISHSRDYNRDTRGVGGSPDFSSLPPEQREIAQAVAGSLASGGGQARQAMEDNVTAGTVGVQATQTLYDAVNNAQLDEAQQRIAQQALSLTVT
ncbi:MAG TPA: TolC family protein, partial [Candidatus Halomonas stercoripullorum]|nr:TolC family protein [Candidatus Halomonas stercoripullorum]